MCKLALNFFLEKSRMSLAPPKKDDILSKRKQEKMFVINSNGQCYEILWICNLQIP